MSNKSIIVYGAEWCAYCHMAMRYLDDKKIKYTYLDVDSDINLAKEAVEKSGQRGIPVIDIGGDIVLGFDRPKIDQLITSHQIA
jgi:glutaredoxin 3